jgi:hypothetical protein
MPLAIPKHLAVAIPRGLGNREITGMTPFGDAALAVVRAISQILDQTGWHLERIAVDAPAAPPALGSRASESELGRLGLSSFRTPAVSAWTDIRQMCADHLGSGGSAATLPHANKIWMLFGFELFTSLKSGLRAEVIEVYPFAIVRALLPACQHKTTEQGYRDKLNAGAAPPGWEPLNLHARLNTTVSGSRHDRLDAFMAAWVASLPRERRHAFGDAQRPDDAIWVPL